jgi:hypothetical protein
MKAYAALGASVCLLAAATAGPALASYNPNHLPSLPPPGSGNGGSSAGHHDPGGGGGQGEGWRISEREREWRWLLHHIADHCRPHHGHGFGHGGWGDGDGDDRPGDHDGDHDDNHCHPHPVSP